MSEPVIITSALSIVDCSSKSILSTGKLKFEGGQLYQEATVIVHKEHGDEKLGVTTRWFPVPEEIVASIKAS